MEAIIEKRSDLDMVVTVEEFKELEPEMYYNSKLPPLYENVFLWTGSEWLITYLWSVDKHNLRWNCMGLWSQWPIWVKIKKPDAVGSALAKEKS